ncbi:MAG: protein-L-isoaspartate O-methyltransferase, partial [Thermoplasmata archaeon]|nr:protein-L-isoaspartate O-methyltransferase [Thermoplasmata archaeon]NIS13298.1 protein-L-isoaspartate O-methyltransferase [Thermoplasmata archaeon]NIS21196.1 protein-L-isoaspartate O-methyltransferase [Thermoplasmata archaeon]NIT75697.1 protein-L-isoaspartate O-methyltransferase [Thermoplasmata archaeon]NIU50254.1 protein-L-isoaspartate O-methyltransferase [Thermoplasmata archaeon]
MVRHLERAGYIKTDPVRQAMMDVRREDFMPESMRYASYADRPQDIGQGQTISAPHMVAIMVEAMRAKEGQR